MSRGVILRPVMLLVLALFASVLSIPRACDLLFRASDPEPLGYAYTSLAWGSGTWVAVGPDGMLGRSADGLTWASECSGSDYDFRGLTHGEPGFLAISGGRGQFLVHTSADGLRWQSQSLDTLDTQVFFHRAFGAGTRLFGADPPYLYSTSDGREWGRATLPGIGDVWGVAYGNGLYVAADYGMRTCTSPDGSTWTSRVFPYGQPCTGLAFGGGRFVLQVFSGGGMYAFYSSADGQNWSPASHPPAQNAREVLYHQGRFLCLTADGLLRSIDGQAWEMIPFSSPSSIVQIASSGEELVALTGEPGLMTSVDGVNWDQHFHRVLEDDPYGLLYSQRLDAFVAAGFYGSLYLSRDGESWSRVFTDRSYNFMDMAEGPMGLVATGVTGKIVLSGDGETWEDVTPPFPEDLRSVAYGNGRFLAVGRAGAVFSSEDGQAWTREDGGFRNDLARIAFGNGRFVAVGPRGAILSTTDGRTWMDASSTAPGQELEWVSFCGGRFFIAALSLLESADGLTWSPIAGAPPLDRVWYAGGWYYGLGLNRFYKSQDGERWEPFAGGLGKRWYLMAEGRGMRVAMAYMGVSQATLVYARACFPEVSSVLPPDLPPAGGVEVVIQGRFLEGATAVAFGDLPSSSFTVVSDTEIRAVAPPSARAARYVTVTTEGGTSLGTDRNLLVYGDRPVIASVKKMTSPFRLKVIGSGFSPYARVAINGTWAPSTTVKGPGKIVVGKSILLKNLLPKGEDAIIVVVDQETGIPSRSFHFVP